MSDGLNRRQFVVAGAAAAAAVAVAFGVTGCAPSDVDPLARPQILDALGDDVVRAIGRRYRQQHPDESDGRALRAALGVPASGAAAVEAITARVAADFASGRTVVVDGWVLSLTEARQCALHSVGT